mmetsp:Transcript_35539/g.77814  ORF Transcript_35539/g.77814 Transcript_35539/m.77814 type:complete len:176 (-) Transcript_35539:341-868(-)
MSEVQRQAIYMDPLWQDGNYSPEAPPSKGLAVARMMAMLTYRTHPAYKTKFGRSLAATHSERVFNVETYLREQGDKIGRRGFDPMTYVTLTQALDSHDVERGRAGYEQVLRSVTQTALIVSISSDVIYPISEQAELAVLLPNAEHHIVTSDEGHDGFILETRKVGLLVRGFLEQL